MHGKLQFNAFDEAKHFKYQINQIIHVDKKKLNQIVPPIFRWILKGRKAKSGTLDCGNLT